ncbi:MAG: 2-C-methyl-D-erythritol 4-phosphate cytidylyltransferase [Flavobacteriales bacterium]|nr:2-C-methyl-D-erythritol 4-phosphate cytidylyltransferase [Flavobacteriales bacterium]
MHKYAIIVAGGKGERMGEQLPKQFLELAGKPILMHTIEKFKNTFQDIEIILALPENQIDFWEELCYKYGFTKIPHQIVAGGKTRFHSVKNALALVKQNGIVAVHDGVRPLVSAATITNCFTQAEKSGSAIPVVDVVDSLRFVSKQEQTNKAVARSCYKNVQTPQCFKSELLLKAYEQDFDETFNDDASVVEKLGHSIELVQGNTENIKITSPIDLIVAEALLSR